MAEIRFTKWGGKRHWRYPLEVLGSDGYGWWLGGRTGILLRRGFEEPIVQPHDFVVLVPDEGCWIANFNAANPGSDIEIYVDVTDRPVRDGELVHAVDLDLDVIRRFDGRVEVLDEDEFAEHQLTYGYPADVIARASATTAELVESMKARTEPFGEVGAAWVRTFRG
jgi:predicted RNA-binding protein associated with RNAse of E/G family